MEVEIPYRVRLRGQKTQAMLRFLVAFLMALTENAGKFLSAVRSVFAQQRYDVVCEWLRAVRKCLSE